MQTLSGNRPCVLPRSAPAQLVARQIVCRAPASAKRRRLSASPVCSAAVADSPSKQGDDLLHAAPLHPQQCTVAQCKPTAPLLSADKQVFQHDGALEEVDDEVYNIIKQEKGRQVRTYLLRN